MGGTTNIYLYMVDRCMEPPRIYVVSRGVDWKARIVSHNVVIMDVRSETSDIVGSWELAS